MILKFYYVYIYDREHFIIILLLYRVYIFCKHFELCFRVFIFFVLICDFDSDNFFSLISEFFQLLSILTYYLLCLKKQLICKLWKKCDRCFTHFFEQYKFWFRKYFRIIFDVYTCLKYKDKFFCHCFSKYSQHLTENLIRFKRFICFQFIDCFINFFWVYAFC